MPGDEVVTLYPSIPLHGEFRADDGRARNAGHTDKDPDRLPCKGDVENRWQQASHEKLNCMSVGLSHGSARFFDALPPSSEAPAHGT